IDSIFRYLRLFAKGFGISLTLKIPTCRSEAVSDLGVKRWTLSVLFFNELFKRRRACFPAHAALILEGLNVDCRSSQISRSPRWLSLQPTGLSSQPRVEHGVPVKD